MLWLAQAVLHFVIVPGALPPAPPPPPAVTYESLSEAATYALKAAYTMSPYYEYSGQILQLADGKFAVVPPETQYAGDSSHSDPDPASYKFRIAAGYHTHPCLPYSHVPHIFSPQDLRWARVTKTPEFMLDMCTGDVHAYDPATDKLTIEQIVGGAAVRTVGHVSVSGTPLEREQDVE